MSEFFQDEILQQVYNSFESQLNHHYVNCNLEYSHNDKQNINVYLYGMTRNIYGIIHVGLCYTMNIIVLTGLSTTDPSANTFNSEEKDSISDPVFIENYDIQKYQSNFTSFLFIFGHQMMHLLMY